MEKQLSQEDLYKALYAEFMTAGISNQLSSKFAMSLAQSVPDDIRENNPILRDMLYDMGNSLIEVVLDLKLTKGGTKCTEVEAILDPSTLSTNAVLFKLVRPIKVGDHEVNELEYVPESGRFLNVSVEFGTNKVIFDAIWVDTTEKQGRCRILTVSRRRM